MPYYNSDFFLYKKISTAFCLSLIFFFSACVAAYCLWQSQKLKELQKPLPYYISVSKAINATSAEDINF